MKKKAVKVVKNIWGNLNCYVGAEVVEKFSDEWAFDAREWLSKKLSEGHPLSPKSDISLVEIEEHNRGTA